MPERDQSFYPAEMADALSRKWVENEHPADVLPPVEALIVLLDRMYQASLMREEGQTVKCRIIVASPDTFAEELSGRAGDLVVLRFTIPCALTPNDVRKLAAAAGYYRAVLAVDASQPLSPVIWGVVITGTNWVNRLGGDRFDETPLPPNLVIQILAPGHLIVASGYSRVFESSGGKLLAEGFDPFRSTWLPERFRVLRASRFAAGRNE